MVTITAVAVIPQQDTTAKSKVKYLRINPVSLTSAPILKRKQHLYRDKRKLETFQNAVNLNMGHEQINSEH